jgi:hypothetical protein
MNIHVLKRLADRIQRVYRNIGSNKCRQHSILRFSAYAQQVVLHFNYMISKVEARYDIASNMSFGQDNFNGILGMHKLGDSTALDESTIVQEPTISQSISTSAR